MRTVGVVFRKELLDTLRDRRTIVFMIVIPLLVFPILFQVMTTVQRSFTRRERTRTLRVAVVAPPATAAAIVDVLRDAEGIRPVTGVTADSARARVERDSLDAAIVVADDFDDALDALRAARVDVWYRSGDDDSILRTRLRRPLEAWEDALLERRFEQLGIPRSAVHALETRMHNLASAQERLGRTIGGFLPYLFIIFSFVGAMYPAIDLGAGEKERGTLETLLTAPVGRLEILLGKFGVVVLSSMVSAVVSILGLYVGFRRSADLPPEFEQLVLRILGPATILRVLSLLLPLSVFFAGLLLSVSITARSFKEAQSMISPLNIAVIVPAAIGLTPGIELTPLTALVPVLNVSLATREIVAGTAGTLELALVYASLGALAVGALWGSALWFRRESIIFRS